ncbi:L-lactate permease [Vibrio lentus]|nr:L-lactate permease [Vibrio lentus]
MPVAFTLTVAVALFAWDMSSTRVLAGIQGFGITVSVLWIVFGAIFLLNTFKTHQGMPPSATDLLTFQQTVVYKRSSLLGVFGSFIEGASGFSTPAAIAAPLLVAIGFSVSWRY